jgi:hypothetical protein
VLPIVRHAPALGADDADGDADGLLDGPADATGDGGGIDAEAATLVASPPGEGSAEAHAATRTDAMTVDAIRRPDVRMS